MGARQADGETLQDIVRLLGRGVVQLGGVATWLAAGESLTSRPGILLVGHEAVAAAVEPLLAPERGVIQVHCIDGSDTRGYLTNSPCHRR